MNFRVRETKRKNKHSPVGCFKRNRLVFSLFFLFITTASLLTSCTETNNNINLTEDEQSFLNEHPVIQLGIDPEFVPFEFIDENEEYKGIAADYLDLISSKSGLEFEVVKDLTWPEAYDRALEGNIDALPAVGKTSEREEHFLFSQPYYYFKRVIVTRDDDTSISGMDDLAGLIVAVQRNSSHHSYLLTYPNINLSLYDSVEAALTAVKTGEERVFVGNLATTYYLIKTNGLTDLRFVAFEAEISQALYFATRKEWPALISIFNKALNTITEKEKQIINNKWIDLSLEIDYGPIIRAFAIGGTFVLAILGITFFWIVRLKKEIFQRKQIQLDLEKAKHEADEANDFKSSFMARMSHEIRTPLNAITGMSYLLKKTDLSLTQKMYADRVTQASSNMLSIINDILDYSKIEAGKVELENAPFSLDQIIQDVVNIVSYKIEEQGIGFNISKDPLVPNWFFGDSKRIEQILLNVLNNAAKFTSKGEVSLNIRLIAKENDKYHLAFTIKDTGIGMDEEQVKKIFVPFTQGDSSITRRFGGSGLGLSIVKNLLDMMGGQIEVFSTLNEGSTFIISLSLSTDKEKEEIYRKSLSGEHFKNIRVLVLEKAGANMNLIENYLSAFGVHCELTSSPSSALNMLEAANGKFTKFIDLFILDYETPVEGGFEFVQSIRHNDKILNKPKIIMLLPMMHEELFDKLNEYKIDIGIEKPIIQSILFNGILDIFKLKAVSEMQPNDENMKSIITDKSYLVLVVEDNKTNQLIAKSLLEQIGVKSILASNGNEAVALFDANVDKIDLILLDLHMPVMNGYDAAKAIRKKSSSVPIVAMTADVIVGVKEKCIESGIYHYISKPFDPDLFLKTIRKILLENDQKSSEESKMLDIDTGLKNMGGNAEFYQQVLSEYYNENQDILTKLSQAVDEKRYTDAVQIVHKIKSSSGSIGAKSLYELSKKLQKSLDDEKEEQIINLYKDFEWKFKKLLSEISEYNEKNALEKK